MKLPMTNYQLPITSAPRAAPHSPFVIRHLSFPAPRAFSLVEVLLAIFILGIGMIMVASVFPVGATWTRQTAEESIAQTVAQNALSVLQTHYGPNGNLHVLFAPDYMNPGNPNTVLCANFDNLHAMPDPTSPFVLQAFPGFANISPCERAYQFGSTNPFPAANPRVCTYFWTALLRLNPAHYNGDPATNKVQPSSSYNYDVYILVFRKGSADHQFTNPPLPAGATSFGEVANTRNPADANFQESLIPSVVYAKWQPGWYDSAQSPSIHDALPGIGQYGIGAYSGTVFRQVADPASNYQSATPRPLPIAGESVIYSPAPDATASNASPLIYIYQTTMSF